MSPVRVAAGARGFHDPCDTSAGLRARNGSTTNALVTHGCQHPPPPPRMLAVNSTAEVLKSLGRFDLFQEQIQRFAVLVVGACVRKIKVANGRGG